MEKEEIISQLREAQKIISSCVIAIGGADHSAKISKGSAILKTRPSKIVFSLNERNFVKTYARGLNGEKKFTLLLAYLTKGKIGFDIPAIDVSTLWGKMTAKELLGTPYNGKYPTAAKTNGWIDSKKYGTYQLHGSWREIFS